MAHSQLWSATAQFLKDTSVFADRTIPLQKRVAYNKSVLVL